MKLFGQLIGISLRSGIGTKKQKPITMVFIALIFCYAIGILSFLLVSMARSASSAGLDCSFVLSYGLIISSFFILLFTVSSSSNILFKSKDNNLLLPMPLKKLQIVLSRLAGCLLLCYVYELMFFVPSIVIYFCFSSLSFPLILTSIVAFFFAPLLVFAISVAFSALLNYITAKLRYKNLFNTAGMFILALAFLYIYFSLDFSSQNMFAGVSDSFFIFRWTVEAIGGNLLSLLWLVLTGTASMILIFLLTSAVHQKIASASATVFNSKRAVNFNEQSQLTSFVKKELKKIFSTPIVLFNNCFGLLLLVFAIVFLFIEKNNILAILGQIPLSNFSLVMISVVLITTPISTCNTSSISISLERSYIYYLKCLPISVNKILFAKGLCNFILCAPFIVIGSISLCLFLNLSFLSGVLICLICSFLIACFCIFGIFINLKLPRVDAPNDTVITKQSFSSMIGVMVPMLSIAVVSFVYFMYLIPYISIVVFTAIILVIFAFLSLTILLYLKKNAKKLFINL